MKTDHLSNNESIGERITRLMQARGFSQKMLAQETGLTESAISRYVSNERIPKMANAKLISDALNTTPAALIYGENEPVPESSQDIIERIKEDARKLSDAELVRLISELQDAREGDR